MTAYLQIAAVCFAIAGAGLLLLRFIPKLPEGSLSLPSKPSPQKATLAEFRRVRKHLSEGGLTESALKEFDSVLLSVIIAGEDQ